MFLDSELKFICEVLNKSRVRAVVVSPEDTFSEVIGEELGVPMNHYALEQTAMQQLMSELAPRTVYKATGADKLCYIYFLLPDKKKTSVLLIGPYLSETLSHQQKLEIGENNGISPKSQKYLDEYYTGIPVLKPDSHLFVMLNTFCEHLWDNPSFSVVDVNQETQLPASPINELGGEDHFDEVLMGMTTMEKRYQFENELIQAVAMGQIHKETQMFSMFAEQHFEKRVADPLRNAKNYCIIMNTLLRKAAENGGVHPVYLNNVSSAFAIKIEQLPDLGESAVLMHEMFRSYCRLVRKHSMKDYSLAVQKAILLIDSELSAELSLKSLADSQNISPGYLSTIFKRETGKTVSEYIREKRVKHAIYLLSTTHLQVQTVALHCGIVDVQYFSKIFKKQTGKTPKEFRESIRQIHKNPT